MLFCTTLVKIDKKPVEDGYLNFAIYNIFYIIYSSYSVIVTPELLKKGDYFQKNVCVSHGGKFQPIGLDLPIVRYAICLHVDKYNLWVVPNVF